MFELSEKFVFYIDFCFECVELIVFDLFCVIFEVWCFVLIDCFYCFVVEV